jgi:hypothetical protein
MTCLITGCDLVDVAGGRWVHGDLHRIGHSYVFNAVLLHTECLAREEHRGEAAWVYEPPPPSTIKQLIIDNALAFAHQCFECRGVIVFPLVFGRLNDVAAAYLGGTPA